ncbi:MAG: hypothetical protein AAGB22_14455, partial [Bacteroidota bacterium]
MDEAQAEALKQQRKAVLQDLAAEDEKIVMAALHQVSHVGDASMITPMVDLLLNPFRSDNVKKTVRKTLNQLKDTTTIDPLLDAINQDRTAPIRHELVAAFWESGLQVDNRIPDFVNSALSSDYLTCMECLTVIENMEGPFDEQDVMTAIQKIQ